MSQFTQHPLPIPTGSPFTIANIPFGIFSTADEASHRPGVAIGDYVLDLHALADAGHISIQHTSTAKFIFSQPVLNEFAALPSDVRTKVRKDIQALIQDEKSPLYKREEQSKFLFNRAEVTTRLPMQIGGFTDYSCSLEHMTNAGRLAGFPKLPPSFHNQPSAYNGRVSSIVISGTPIKRPHGFLIDGDGGAKFTSSKKLDYEVEVGVFVSKSIPFGTMVPASKAQEHIFGLVLLNDWSARDIQLYEMMPLGPFNGKACGTSISPWIITLDALQEAGSIIPADKRGLQGGKATSLPFLSSQNDISLEVSTFLMRGYGRERALISKGNLRHMHWSPFQMLAHHTSAGCGLASGDLLGTGTLSSSQQQAEEDLNVSSGNTGRLGCLYELTEAGKVPVKLAEGNGTLTWLEDGDEITLEGWAGEGDSRIGFGSVTGKILPPTAQIPS